MGIIRLHLYGFFAGFLLDMIIGDPHWFIIHPVRLYGGLIALLDKFFLGASDKGRHKEAGERQLILSEYATGVFTLAIVVLLSGAGSALILYLCYRISDLAFMIAEAIITCTALSGSSLIRETTPVRRALEDNDIGEARRRLSFVVGRDTDHLSCDEIARATVETLAENLSDGIISPLFFLALGGPCAGLAFKAVSTADSMIGYKSRRYYSFGRASARTDDLLNLIPARLSALLIMAASFLLKGCSASRAFKVCRRDHGRTESPNAGYPESAMAGSLGIRLGGAASYNGSMIERPCLGEGSSDKEPDCKAIVTAQRIVRLSTLLMEIICLFVLYFTVICCRA